jgi:hypothetical protein
MHPVIPLGKVFAENLYQAIFCSSLTVPSPQHPSVLFSVFPPILLYHLLNNDNQDLFLPFHEYLLHPEVLWHKLEVAHLSWDSKGPSEQEGLIVLNTDL